MLVATLQWNIFVTSVWQCICWVVSRLVSCQPFSRVLSVWTTAQCVIAMPSSFRPYALQFYVLNYYCSQLYKFNVFIYPSVIKSKIFQFYALLVLLLVVVVEMFRHGAVKATFTNAPQSQLNKWVFSIFLNWATVVSDWRSEAGRLFQSLGPATSSSSLYLCHSHNAVK